MRPSVKLFAEAMEKALREHDEDRGEDGWKTANIYTLLNRLEGEVQELAQAIYRYTRADPWDPDDEGVGTPKLNKSAKSVLKEASDVGNFAMFIADIVGMLVEPPQPVQELAPIEAAATKPQITRPGRR